MKLKEYRRLQTDLANSGHGKATIRAMYGWPGSGVNVPAFKRGYKAWALSHVKDVRANVRAAVLS